MKTYLSLLILACTCCFRGEAARDHTPPGKPGNFQVAGKTPFSTTVALTSSTDNSGDFSSLLASTAQPSERVTLPKTAI